MEDVYLNQAVVSAEGQREPAQVVVTPAVMVVALTAVTVTEYEVSAEPPVKSMPVRAVPRVGHMLEKETDVPVRAVPAKTPQPDANSLTEVDTDPVVTATVKGTDVTAVGKRKIWGQLARMVPVAGVPTASMAMGVITLTEIEYDAAGDAVTERWKSPVSVPGTVQDAKTRLHDEPEQPFSSPDMQPKKELSE